MDERIVNNKDRSKKIKAMTITYEVDGALYVNITNRCTNDCLFCIRNNGDSAYDSDSLWLRREPDKEEILDSVFSHDLNIFRELVFCGYGEPTCRLDVARQVALTVKERFPGLPIRINTNGQSDLYYGRDTSPMYKDAFDTVSVSLNSGTKEKYQYLCRPVYGNKAFPAILAFAKNVKNYVQKVLFSVVGESLDEGELSLCLEIARECGVELRVRDYVAAEGSGE